MPRVGRLIRGTGMAVIAGLVLSACSNGGFDQSAATKVLQSVDVNLDSSAAITEVAGQAVYLDEISGESDSAEDSYAIEEVVDDLPVRVSTRYQTDDGSGTNLDELEGHTGRVNIEVTVENLTLESSELTYDVAGESRQTPALVGTPLSIAGSTELEGTRASNVVLDSESGDTTNGVVSQTSDGDAVVQWGTVLAPPQSEATTSFHLVADVEDFSAPEIDIAVQAGFHTDMSFEGMLTAAFDTSANSEYAMQQNAIELVAEVNDVLTRAGTTITDIRTTLDHTSETLGVDAARQLRQNSDDMVAEMERVGEQLTALETQVDDSLSGAETAMNSQLSQIVGSMNSMLGNTDATAPQLVQGQGCAATVKDAESNGSLYSTFLILGAQLDGYAQANAECRDEIVADIEQILGPEVPNAEACDSEKGNANSITCSLYAAQNSVLTSLDTLAESGESIIEDLNTKDVSKAAGHNKTIGQKLEAIDEDLDEILNPSEKDNQQDKDNDPEESDEAEKPKVTWKSLNRKIRSTREALKELDDTIEPHRASAIDGIDLHAQSLKEDFEGIHFEAGELSEDHHDLAEEVCSIRLPPNEDDIELDQLDQISIRLTGYDCDSNPDPNGEEDSQSFVERIEGLIDDNRSEEIDDFVEHQKDHWQEAIQELDHESDASAASELDTSLKDIQEDLRTLRKLVKADTKEQVRIVKEAAGVEADRIKGLVESIQEAKDQAQTQQEDLEAALERLKEYEKELPQEIRQAFQKVIDDTSEELPEQVDEQVRIVTDRIDSARDSVIDSYNSTITGLSTTSDAVTDGTAKQLDKQKGSLEEQQEATTSALSESTSAVIESIHDSTASSTRDLEGASAQLGASLNNVILDLGDPDIEGSGILGSMSASSAMSDTADYQLALASQRASGYANVRSEDIGEIMLRQAQFSASLEAANSLPAFHLDVPSGARSQTIYAFHIGGGK